VSEVMNNAMDRTMRDGVAHGVPNSLDVEASSGEDSPMGNTVGVAAEVKKVGVTAEATKRKWLTQMATSHSRSTLDAYTMSGDLGEGFEQARNARFQNVDDLYIRLSLIGLGTAGLRH
jgi:hypothetical protein